MIKLNVKLHIVTFCAAIIVIISIFNYRADALDRLGSQWNGCEYTNCEWKFQWRRTNANSNIFNAYWYHHQYGKVQGQISISISGSTVTVSRPAIGGGPPCTYTGTYEKRDIHNARPAMVSGTYTCGSYTGPWKATIH